ncbi:unnamed protein product [Adineta steineri]|uniref:Uncharacterized protein n=1 Tax=Adineta steineri TaxID=433720 RepID=A0A814A756_9BILA|nr:unnamed protein product [Adineta steineri]
MVDQFSFISKKRKYILLTLISSLCVLLLYKKIDYSIPNTIFLYTNIKESTSTFDTNATTTLTTKKLNIGIIIVSDAKAQQQYKQYGKNLECYAKQHGYTFIILNPKDISVCSHFNNFFFQKHCVVRNYMISMSNLHWLLVLDGDNFIVNSSKLIEEYIPNDENIHVVHYERFYTGEIMAGAYLIQNHVWSHKYLSVWVSFYSKLPKTGYHNHDNGALHMVFLEMIGKDSASQEKCYSKYLQSTNEWNYYKYLRCCRCAIGGQRIFKHVHLLRRGHGFSRDFAVPFINDFILHGYKSDLNKYFYHTDKCTNDWLSNIRQELFVFNMSIARNMTIEKDQYAIRKYSISLGIPDISDCWPNCEKEITGEKLVKYLRALCHD